MVLQTYPVERVGKSVLAEVGESLILDLEGRVVGYIRVRTNLRLRARPRHTGLGDGLLRVSLLNSGLVGTSVDEAVVDDLDGGVVGGQERDLVGDGGGVGEGGDVLSGTSEAEDEVLAVGTRQLGLALLSDDGDVGLGGVQEDAADLPRHTGVDTTAKTLVRGADHEQCLVAVVEGLGLGAFEDLVGGLTVGARGGHGPLGAGELGGGDDLHGLGDLLDVANRLEAALDLTESGVASGGGDGPAHANIQSALDAIQDAIADAMDAASAGVGGRKAAAPGGAYRATAAAMPARMAGRAARDSIMARNWDEWRWRRPGDGGELLSVRASRWAMGGICCAKPSMRSAPGQCGRRHVPGPHAARPGHCIARAMIKLQFAEKLFV